MDRLDYLYRGLRRGSGMAGVESLTQFSQQIVTLDFGQYLAGFSVRKTDTWN